MRRTRQNVPFANMEGGRPDPNSVTFQQLPGRSLTSDLWVPLVPDVLVGGGARDGEADDEDVGLRVRQRPESVVLLLTRGVPQVQTDDPAVHGHLNAPRTHSQAFL